MMENRVKRIIGKYGLKPLSIEGGYYTETYRSESTISGQIISTRHEGLRAISTAILYLLTPDTFSAIHRLPSDEIYHFYAGDPVDLLLLFPDGSGRIVTLGSDVLSGMEPQFVVKANTWQGSFLRSGGKFALLGTTVAPGFEFSDYTGGDRTELISSYGEFRDYIIRLTG